MAELAQRRDEIEALRERDRANREAEESSARSRDREALVRRSDREREEPASRSRDMRERDRIAQRGRDRGSERSRSPFDTRGHRSSSTRKRPRSLSKTSWIQRSSTASFSARSTRHTISGPRMDCNDGATISGRVLPTMLQLAKSTAGGTLSTLSTRRKWHNTNQVV